MIALAVLLSAASLATDVAQLDWLAGAWEGDDAGTWNEEVWSEPKGGTMLAFHRDTRAGTSVSFEFLRVEQGEGGLVYLAMPRGAPATPFKLVESGAERAVFEREANDFPKRVLYWREGDALHARIEGTHKGRPAAKEWVWRKRAQSRSQGG
jgi:Domain of unknown function (DUF6265)